MSEGASETVRAIDPAAEAEEKLEAGLRPQSLDEFVGQEKLRRNLRVFIEAEIGRASCRERV